jgi:hypothetical protein
MFLVVVVAVAAVGVVSGWRRAGVVGVSASFAWVALVVPFLSAGLTRFSPLHVAAKVTGTRGVTVGIVVIALVAAALSVRSGEDQPRAIAASPAGSTPPTGHEGRVHRGVVAGREEEFGVPGQCTRSCRRSGAEVFA